jgi:hypothetical protein
MSVYLRKLKSHPKTSFFYNLLSLSFVANDNDGGYIGYRPLVTALLFCVCVQIARVLPPWGLLGP